MLPLPGCGHFDMPPHYYALKEAAAYLLLFPSVSLAAAAGAYFDFVIITRLPRYRHLI